MSLWRKFLSIPMRMFREGPINYLRERHELGPHRYHLKRWLCRGRLSKESCAFRNFILDLPSGSPSGIVEELVIFGDHEPQAREIYEEFLQPGMRVLEVGTNIGFYLAVESGRIGPSGQIVGFEPDPDIFRIAERNAGRLNTPCMLHNMAVSDHRGTVKFYRSDTCNWGTLFDTHLRDDRPPLEVSAVTIDEFCRENDFAPDALRMDIEGGELKALPGAKEVLEKHQPLIYIEIHPVVIGWEKTREVIGFLRQAGYDRFIVINRCTDWPWVLPSRRAAEVFRCSLSEVESLTNSHQPASVFSLITGRGAE